MLAADGSTVTAETRCRDVTHLDDTDLRDATLVTSSALLDLLSADQLRRLVRRCNAAGCPVLFTLTVTGAVDFTPSHPVDELVTAAFNDHQRRTVGVADSSARTPRRRRRACSPTSAATWRRGRVRGSCLRRVARSRASGCAAGWRRPASRRAGWRCAPTATSRSDSTLPRPGDCGSLSDTPTCSCARRCRRIGDEPSGVFLRVSSRRTGSGGGDAGDG